MNAAWTQEAIFDRVALPEGTEVWLPPGTLNRTTQLNQISDSALAQADKAMKSQ
jgi:hypothetical protein